MAAKGSRYLTMTQFGKLGRWGNQIIELMYMSMYAWKHDLWLQMPPWVGDELFGKKCAEMPPTDQNFIGTIDEVLIWNRALSDAELATWYTNTRP